MVGLVKRGISGHLQGMEDRAGRLSARGSPVDASCRVSGRPWVNTRRAALGPGSTPAGWPSPPRNSQG